MEIATVAFDDLPSIGGRMVITRGVTPSLCQFIAVPSATEILDRKYGDLVWTYGATSVTFSDCAVVACPLRIHHGRPGYTYEMIVADRRWKWRYPRITGEYNKRSCNGEIQADLKKSARQLATLLLDELGETGYDVSDVPDNVWPYVNWDRSPARLELAWLCDLLAMVVVPDVVNDVFKVVKLNDTTGQELPPGAGPVTPTEFGFKESAIPSDLRVTGPDDLKQGPVALRAVGLDTDGDRGLITGLNYDPTDQWWSAFPTVPQSNRHLAFQTAYRWFEPSNANIQLKSHSLESGTNTDGKLYCAPPQIRGVFWPLCDHRINTGANTIHNGEFYIDEEKNLVVFAYPVIKWNGGEPVAPDLYVVTAYKEKVNDEYPYFFKDKEVDEAVQEAGENRRVVVHPELQRRVVNEALYGQGGDNLASLQAEADVYLNSIDDSYAYDQANDVEYEGIVNISPDGAIAQVIYTAGRDLVAKTRLGRMTEPDVYTMHHQKRRAEERLSQMAERMNL